MSMQEITSRQIDKGNLTLYENKEKGFINAKLTDNTTIVIDAINIIVSGIGFSNYDCKGGIPISELKPEDRIKVFSSIGKRDIRLKETDKKVKQIYIQATRDSLITRKSFDGGDLAVFVRYYADNDEKKTLFANWRRRKETDQTDFTERQFFLVSADEETRTPYVGLTEEQKTTLIAGLDVKKITVTDSEILIYKA